MNESATGFTGSCPICNCQLNGRVHNCPGVILPNPQGELLGAQYVDEFPREERRYYGSRLESGFAMLSESGWDGDY